MDSAAPSSSSAPKLDPAVREWSGSKPKLRSDIRFHYQRDRGRPVYVLEDLVSRRYLQVGLPEYRFLRGLDGTRTAKELIADNARAFGQDALNEQEASMLLRWLVDEHLLDTGDTDRSMRHYQHKEQAKEKQGQGFGPMKLIFLRLPLGSPDRLLGLLTPLFGWTFSLAFFLIWLGFVSYALFLAASNWQSLVHASLSAVLPSNWIFLLAVYVSLKLIHELWHGIATKKFGGVVPEWGIQLIALITPLTYVDASSSWSFAERSKRFVVAGAGMYVEFFIAAIAMIVWTQTEPGLLNTLASNTIFAASTVTLLFNANPLMRFDGYYMLSDALRIRNLGTKGMMLTQWMGKRFILGMKKVPMPPGTRQRTFTIGLYGILSMLWRLVITIGIMAILSTLFEGAGIILALMLGLGMVGMSLYKFGKFLFTGGGGARPSLLKSSVRLGILGAGIASILWFVQIQPSPRALGVIEFPDKISMRVESPGFVEAVHCASGEPVQEGQLLATLSNPSLHKALAETEVYIRRSELRCREFLNTNQLASYQAELKALASLKERHRIQLDRVHNLEVRAPANGTVVAQGLDSLPGRFLGVGEELATILPTTAPRLLISARQEDLPILREEQAQRVRIRLRGRHEDLYARISRVESRATTAVPHRALASSSGGPLLVRSNVEMTSERERGLATMANDSESMTHFAGVAAHRNKMEARALVRPRFAAYADLELEPSQLHLSEGEWGYVKLTETKKHRLGVWLGEKVARYIRRRFEDASKY